MNYKKGMTVRVKNDGMEYEILEDPKHNGNTWSARVQDKTGGEIYFLKFSAEDSMMECLKRETQFVKNYPYIVNVYDGFQGMINDQEVYCILEEYIDGMDLKEWRQLEQSEEDIFFYMLQLLYVARYYTTYSKQAPFVHRDLKPQNIMVDEKNKRVVLIDFNSSHISGSTATRMGTIPIGCTDGYCPTEEVWSDNVQRDIYAMGVTFIEILNGKTAKWKDQKPYGGIENTIIESPYNDGKYQKLLEIIDKMISSTENRYKEFTTIFDDFYKFLKEFYSSEDLVKFDDISILKKVEYAIEDEWKIDVIFSLGTNTMKLKNNEIIEIADDNKVPIMSIYFLNNQLYYVPFDSKLKKETETEYQISNQDKFYYGNEEITFKIKKIRNRR